MPDSEDYPQFVTSCTQYGKSLCKAASLQGMVGVKETGLTCPHSHFRAVLKELRRFREEVVALEAELASGPEFRDRCSVPMDVSGEKLKTRSNIPGESRQAAAIAGLPAVSNEECEACKGKATETTNNDIQLEVGFD